MDLSSLGKIIIALGVALVVIGGLVWVLGRTGLPLGNYKVYEVLPGGWVPIYPASHDLDLIGGTASFTFFNKIEGASPTETGSWGKIKGLFK